MLWLTRHHCTLYRARRRCVVLSVAMRQCRFCAIHGRHTLWKWNQRQIVRCSSYLPSLRQQQIGYAFNIGNHLQPQTDLHCAWSFSQRSIRLPLRQRQHWGSTKRSWGRMNLSLIRWTWDRNSKLLIINKSRLKSKLRTPKGIHAMKEDIDRCDLAYYSRFLLQHLQGLHIRFHQSDLFIIEMCPLFWSDADTSKCCVVTAIKSAHVVAHRSQVIQRHIAIQRCVSCVNGDMSRSNSGNDTNVLPNEPIIDEPVYLMALWIETCILSSSYSFLSSIVINRLPHFWWPSNQTTSSAVGSASMWTPELLEGSTLNIEPSNSSL